MDPVFYGSIVGGVLFVAILACLALGRWLGHHMHARTGAPMATIGSLETAVFGLLGLLIAFTFSGALSRFDTRRVQAVDEANAIGTAYLRIDLVPAAAQPKLRDTMRAYTDARIATYKKLPDIAAARAEVERSQALQSEIWQQAVAATQLKDARLGSDILLLPAVNAMFDISSVRLAATQIHPPTIVYIMLIALALASALLAGYQSAADKDYDWIHKLGFAAIVSLTVYVILDIEYPRLGLVRLDAIDQLLVDVRASMK
ncbi:MAG: DUF4239 domain-containing protein [Betaproteobacteria bacterium]|nr:DUF4239 domain-containing protein [Betaproteobacteria bacterium]